MKFIEEYSFPSNEDDFRKYVETVLNRYVSIYARKIIDEKGLI